MLSPQFKLALLCLSIPALILLANIKIWGGSSIEHPITLLVSMSGDWASTVDHGMSLKIIENWVWTEQAPFKYRILGKLPVYSTYLIIKNVSSPAYAFYTATILWSYILFVFTALLLVKFCGLLFEKADISTEFKKAIPYFAVILFFFSPPVLFFFKFPVHGTPNDILGYVLILISLIFCLQKRFALLTATLTVSVFCRETSLIVLAVVWFMQVPLLSKLRVSAIPLLTLILYRLLWPGSYNPLDGGFTYNIMYSVQSTLFLFLAFGFLWVTGIQGKAFVSKYLKHQAEFFRSFYAALALVIIITVLFARVREIRIEFILFPYFIPLSILWTYERSREKIRPNLRMIIYVLCTAFGIGGFYVYLVMSGVTENPDLAYNLQHFYFTKGNYLYGGKDGNWVGIFLVYLAVVLVILPAGVGKYGYAATDKGIS